MLDQQQAVTGLSHEQRVLARLERHRELALQYAARGVDKDTASLCAYRDLVAEERS